MTQRIVTRFAPSPTGFLHIGGARTALFNWLFARRMGGTMLLRIEDTDRQRSTDAAIDAIIDGLRWLGLDWDGDPVFQFSRADRHRAVVEEMLARGTAYRCYCTPTELDAMRELATAQGRPPRYDGTWRDRDPSDAPAGIVPAIRLRAEREGETVIDDLVQGRVVIPNKDLDDLVLLRSDGNPTYMLAVVVDDRDMGVTHVIRGVDHLTNAARQIQIARALDWDVPVLAHIPLIHGADGAKLSKRHGALGVDAYRALGYLPNALRNYLVRLGWSHGDQEIFSTQEMVDRFDFGSVGRSAARFDVAKLENLNGHYIRASEDADLLVAIEAMLPHLEPARTAGLPTVPLPKALRETWLAAMPGLKERAKTLIELVEQSSFLYVPRPLPLDDKAKALLDSAARDRLAGIAKPIVEAEGWDVGVAERIVRAYADECGVKLGLIAQPLRAALTGKTTSPGLFDVMAVLGRIEVLDRLADVAPQPAAAR